MLLTPSLPPPPSPQGDFFLDTASMDYRTEALEAVTRQRITTLATAWVRDSRDYDNEGLVPTGPGGADIAKPVQKVGWLSNLFYLSWRALNSAFRNKFAMVVRTFLNVVRNRVFQDAADEGDKRLESQLM